MGNSGANSNKHVWPNNNLPVPKPYKLQPKLVIIDGESLVIEPKPEVLKPAKEAPTPAEYLIEPVAKPRERKAKHAAECVCDLCIDEINRMAARKGREKNVAGFVGPRSTLFPNVNKCVRCGLDLFKGVSYHTVARQGNVCSPCYDKWFIKPAATIVMRKCNECGTMSESYSDIKNENGGWIVVCGPCINKRSGINKSPEYIKSLQAKLNQQGANPVLKVDGIYGARTETAEKLNRDKAARTNEDFDKAVERCMVLGNDSCIREPNDIQVIQRYLNQKGITDQYNAPIKADGQWGDRTIAALKKWRNTTAADTVIDAPVGDKQEKWCSKCNQRTIEYVIQLISNEPGVNKLLCLKCDKERYSNKTDGIVCERCKKHTVSYTTFTHATTKVFICMECDAAQKRVQDIDEALEQRMKVKGASRETREILACSKCAGPFNPGAGTICLFEDGIIRICNVCNIAAKEALKEPREGSEGKCDRCPNAYDEVSGGSFEDGEYLCFDCRNATSAVFSKCSKCPDHYKGVGGILEDGSKVCFTCNQLFINRGNKLFQNCERMFGGKPCQMPFYTKTGVIINGKRVCGTCKYSLDRPKCSKCDKPYHEGSATKFSDGKVLCGSCRYVKAPNKCSNCDNQYWTSSGHDFKDGKTVACADCAKSFFEWRAQEKSAEYIRLKQQEARQLGVNLVDDGIGRIVKRECYLHLGGIDNILRKFNAYEITINGQLCHTHSEETAKQCSCENCGKLFETAEAKPANEINKETKTGSHIDSSIEDWVAL